MMGNRRVIASCEPYHVYPLNDLREHEISSTCWCKPTEDDGVMVHHSMDRREEYENGRKPS
ncbi:MAG: hypothetical protein JWP29_2003 [Rhodoferax sp.]|nr:hypothetical protein [Rhodoferax sp.]